MSDNENFTPQQLKRFREAFDKCDVDGSGDIDRKEVAKLFKRMGQSVGKKELTRMMEKVDTDGNGRIDWEEFLFIMGDAKAYQNADIKATFNLFDVDGDGFIDASELKKGMKTYYGVLLSNDEVNEMLDEADQNGDKKINLAEFKDMLLRE